MTKAYFILQGEHIKIINCLILYVFFDKAYNNLQCIGGTDGTRTRDPLRDRQVF